MWLRGVIAGVWLDSGCSFISPLLYTPQGGEKREAMELLLANICCLRGAKHN
jgi:hypothetical protein